MSEPVRTRVFWTSGREELDVLNEMGKSRPVCASAETAYPYAISGDDMFCITIERYSLDDEHITDCYLKAIDKQEAPRPDRD